MKDLATAVDEALQSKGAARHEVDELILDGQCRAVDLSCLAGMDGLARLSLCNVGLKSLAGFPSLPNLTRLILADNFIKDGLEALSQAPLPSLKFLCLAHNRIDRLSAVESLRELSLTHLDLSDCPIVEATQNYRNAVLDMFPALEVLDNLDREGIELLDDDEEFEESSEEDPSADSADSQGSEMDEGEEDEPMEEPELLNLVTDSEDDQSMVEEESEGEEIHVSVLAGPLIEDEKSDEDYIAEDNVSESDVGSMESDEQISVSHHFAAGSSAGPSGSGPSNPPPGAKRKRTRHGTEDLTRDLPQDEDYADI